MGRKILPMVLRVWSISGSNDEKMVMAKYHGLEKILMFQKEQNIPVKTTPPMTWFGADMVFYAKLIGLAGFAN
jgi:hypothetical protein